MIATVTEMITMSQNARSVFKRFILSVLMVACACSAFAQGTAIPYSIPQYFDANGDPLALGGICTYEAGTTTLANVYTTSALTTAFPNPVRLNASGRPSVSGVTLGIFLSPGRAYKFVLKDATVTTCSPDTGVTLWSVDNIQAVPGSSANLDVTGTAGESISAGDVVYLSTGDGGTNAGQWYKTDADFTTKSTSTLQVGVAPASIATSATGSIRLAGSVTVTGPLSTGSGYYASATAGAMTVTPPANALRIGQADSATSIIVGRYTAPVSPRGPPCGRLTLTSGTPVTTADVTAATTLYYTPAGSCNTLDLYNGVNWVQYPFAQVSIAVPATTNTMYDVFAYDNAGVVALELNAWTNDTTPATAHSGATFYQDGVAIKAGSPTRRYLGSFRTTAVSGQTEDSVLKRYVWNYYNRVSRIVRVVDGTNTWTYGTAAWRQANNSTANQIDVVIGVAEIPIHLVVQGFSSNDTFNCRSMVGVGLDVTNAQATGAIAAWADQNSVTAIGVRMTTYDAYPAIGRHFYAWIEWDNSGGGTTTWYGDNGFGSGIMQAGMSGWIMG